MIRGVPNGPADEHGTYELKELSFGFPPEALREIAAFLEATASEMEKRKTRYWHRHIDTSVPGWAERFPGIDIVVVDLASSQLPPTVDGGDESPLE